MFGNILNSTQIKRLIEQNQITIEPFDEKRFRLAHYALRPSTISSVGDEEVDGTRRSRVLHEFANGRTYTMEPGQYAVVRVSEFIKLPQGIIGHFTPSSSFITRGFSLNAGKLDPGFGALRGAAQHLVVGIKNELDQANVFSSDAPIYLHLIDLRGLGTGSVEFSDDEIRKFLTWNRRFNYANDDGPFYDEA